MESPEGQRISMRGCEEWFWSLFDLHDLHRASEDVRNDRVIVLEAVKKNGAALSVASEDLKKDREIVLEAVKNNGDALYHASENLQNDRKCLRGCEEQMSCSLVCIRESPE